MKALSGPDLLSSADGRTVLRLFYVQVVGRPLLNFIYSVNHKMLFIHKE
jgi:hypothetical protein